MKITNNQEIAPLQTATTGAASAKSEPAQEEKEDRVTLERTKELKATIERAKVGAGGVRAAQLQALEASIRSGTFRTSPQQLAEKLLQAAEVDARLRALLNRD